MEKDSKIFAKRLRQARVLNKMSMDRLAEVMSNAVTKQAISKYESAKMMPNSTILISLSDALDVDPDYFFRPFSFDVNEFKVSFRKKSDTRIKDIDALKVQIQDEIERYLEIEELLGKENDCITQSHGEILHSAEQMRVLASEIRKEWELGNDAIANVQNILESKGIKVISTEAPKGFDGVSGIVNDKEFVVVLNKMQTHVERRRFTCMHELGHLLYDGRFSSELTQRQKERLCDAFASEMLLPTVILQHYFSPGEKISLSELRQLQLVYGISIDAIMYKLKEIGIISESRYKYFLIRKHKSESLTKYVENSCYTENLSSKFESMVYAAVAKELISTSKAASLLHTTVNSIRKHLSVI